METAIDITPAFAETAPAFAETAPAFAETAPAFAETAADINAAPDTAGTTPEPCPPHRRYLCRHIFTDGHRCGSPALRGEAFCYYHHTSRPPRPAAGKSRHIDAWEPFTLGLIEDRASALLVGSQIMTRIASNDLDPTRAGHLIRCLQTIGRFLPSEAQAKRTGEATAAEALIEDPIQDETLGTIAPIAEFPPDAVIEAAAVDEPATKAREREYTAEETAYFDATIKGYGFEPGTLPRPATITDRDIITRANAQRRRDFPTLKPLQSKFDTAGKLLAIHSWLDLPVAWPVDTPPPIPRQLTLNEALAIRGRIIRQLEESA